MWHTSSQKNSGDMLVRKKIYILEKAVEHCTELDSGNVKAGLKLALYYLLKKMAKIVKGCYLIHDQDVEAAEVDKFLEVLHLQHDTLFGDASYILNENRQRKLRKPQSLPADEDVVKIRNYTVSELKSLVESMNEIIQGCNMMDKLVPKFVCLRDLTVSRLTLYNLRRGGEPARLRISEWEEANHDAWISPTSIMRQPNDADKMSKQMKIAYQTGKGNNHMVPVLIPEDTRPAMEMLSDQNVRNAVGVNADNNYMFPSIQNSSSHVSGWHATHRVCMDAKVTDPDKITATKMRHRASMIYAEMDVPESHRQVFYKHMGHSKEINENVYQAPLASAELNIVVPYLQMLDAGPIVRTQSSETTSSYANNSVFKEQYSPGPIVRIQSSETTSSHVHNSVLKEQHSSGPIVCTKSSETTSSHAHNSVLKEQHSPGTKKERQYTRWSEKDTEIVSGYFDQWMLEGRLPGKDDVITFKGLHPEILHCWRTIKTKVFNESKAQERRLLKLKEITL